MNNHLKKIMNKAWLDWHGDMSPEDIPFPESCNPSFRVGFESACEVLLPMLEQAYPTVWAHGGALHMLDGFNQEPDNEWDLLAEKIKAIVEEGD